MEASSMPIPRITSLRVVMSTVNTIVLIQKFMKKVCRIIKVFFLNAKNL